MDVMRLIVMPLYKRLLALIQGSGFSGVLGLAIAIAAYYLLKGDNAASERERRRVAGGQHGAQGGSAAGPSSAASPSPCGPTSASSGKAGAQGGRATPQRDSVAARAVSSRLAGVRRVTLSCPGVLLQPQGGSSSQAGGGRIGGGDVSLIPGASELVTEMCFAGLEVFLLCQVSP